MGRHKDEHAAATYYTTFQVAKFLGVSLPTVVNWIDAGRLSAHRTPGGHRRIGHQELVRFARESAYPLSREFVDAHTANKLLVVDDERDFAELVREYLELKAGYTVEVAHSGFHAGLAVARFRPDMILMDIMMPGMDGFQVLELLRADEETCRIPVLACTAYRDPEIEQRIRTSGFDGYVEKPLRLDELLVHVQKHLELTDL